MGLEEIMAGLGGEGMNMTPIAGEEREKISDAMQHIASLKEGDKVQWKRGMKSSRMPAEGQVVEVFRILPTIKTGNILDGNHAADEDDFTVIFRVGSGIEEFCFDSRRFERVE